jgi:hypothetical protein
MDWPFLITLFLKGLCGPMGIVFVPSIAGALRKPLTFQVPYPLTAGVVIGTIPGARLGGHFSHRVPVKLLRHFLSAIISYAAIRMIYDALTKWREAYIILRLFLFVTILCHLGFAFATEKATTVDEVLSKVSLARSVYFL